VNISTQEKIMRTNLGAGALALAILGGVSFAAAQNAPGSAQGKPNLSQPQGQAVTQGLQNEPSQSAPGYQGQVGSKPPASLSQKQMPDDVTAQVPKTKNYLFVKLPDRILIIDPDSKTVAEIVAAPDTTGSNNPDGAAGPGSQSR
jgi:hypothetical protein